MRRIRIERINKQALIDYLLLTFKDSILLVEDYKLENLETGEDLIVKLGVKKKIKNLDQNFELQHFLFACYLQISGFRFPTSNILHKKLNILNQKQFHNSGVGSHDFKNWNTFGILWTFLLSSSIFRIFWLYFYGINNYSSIIVVNWCPLFTHTRSKSRILGQNSSVIKVLKI